MVKVCHVTSAHSSNDVRIFQKMCISLAASEYDVYLVAPGDSREEHGVHVIGVGKKPLTRIKRMILMARRIYKKALDIDAQIYHIHDPELLPYCMKLKNKGKIVIFDSHEFYGLQIKEKYWLPRPLRMIASKIYFSYETHVFRRLDAVVGICTINGENYFDNRTKQLEYITNAPLLNEFMGCESFEKNTDREKAVCYIGSLSHVRGITQLVKMVEIAKIRLKLAGSFSPTEYEETLKKMPGWEYVDYLGFLQRKQIVNCLSECFAGLHILLPVGQYNISDVLGVKVYEYMACGLPFIVSRTPYADKVVSEHRCGICVDPYNVDEIVDAVIYLRDNPEEAKIMGENGRRAIMEKFNWSVEEAKLIRLYHKLLNYADDRQLFN